MSGHRNKPVVIRVSEAEEQKPGRYRARSYWAQRELDMVDREVRRPISSLLPKAANTFGGVSGQSKEGT